MKKISYKNHKNKKIITIIILIILSILAFLAVIRLSLNAKEKERLERWETQNFASIKEILEYYGCQYIKKTDSEEKDYSLDIYTVFKKRLYNGDKNNESFYNNIIDKIAEFLNYESFRLIDSSNPDDKIEIKVVCDGRKIDTIYINGMEDYFIYMDSQMNLKQFKNMKVIQDHQNLIYWKI